MVGKAWITFLRHSSTCAVQSTFAKRMRPSASGYVSCTASVAASHVGARRWHQGHQGAKKLTTTIS